MASNTRISTLLATMLKLGGPGQESPVPEGITNVAGQDLPRFSEVDVVPHKVPMTVVEHPDGRMSQYPPPETWDDWVEYDGKLWPNQRPGLGVEVGTEKLTLVAEVTERKEGTPLNRRPDGSITNW